MCCCSTRRTGAISRTTSVAMWSARLSAAATLRGAATGARRARLEPMPTRKQRRRQAKAKRHEYEYVYVDEEGNEVEVAEDDVKAERTASRNGRAKPNPRAARGARVQAPSWSRVAKRGLIFAPLMFVTVYLTSSEA